MLLEDLHKPGDVEFRVQREIVYVRNEGRYFLFKVVEGLFEFIIRSVRSIAVLIVCEVIIRAAVVSVRITICLLFFDVRARGMLGTLIPLAFGFKAFRHKLFDVLFGFANALRELGGLQGGQISKACSSDIEGILVVCRERGRRIMCPEVCGARQNGCMVKGEAPDWLKRGFCGSARAGEGRRKIALGRRVSSPFLSESHESYRAPW
jgi:hypothetical protein